MSGPGAWLGAVAAAVLGLAALGTAFVVDLPDVAGELRRLSESLGGWTYAIVGVLVAVETAAVLGVVSPGEAALAVGGAAAAHGAVDLPLLITAAWAAGVAGDAAGFWLGRRHGRAWLVRSGPRIGLSVDRLERLEALVLRWGPVALVAGRFVGLVRAFTPFLAGASAMPARRLAGFSVAGAGAWCAALIAAGYVFAASLESHLDAAGNVALAIAGGVVLVWALRRVRSTADGERRHGSGGSHRARGERVGERGRRRRRALARAGRASAPGEPVGARTRLVLRTADGVSG